MKRLSLLLAVLAAALVLPAPVTAGSVSDQALAVVQKNGDGLYAVISTAKGDIVLKLEDKKSPLTVTNFVGLAEGNFTGKPFYDGLKFHRVVPNFMIQGGDPVGNGTGGPGYQFANEHDPTLKFTGPGVLAMANAGPDTNGSQFFITHLATPHLNGGYTIFGHVVDGQAVVNAIAQGDVMTKVTIVRQGKDAKAFDATKAAFDALRSSGASRAASADQKRIADLTAGFTKTPSGLYYKVTNPGTGPKPKKGQTLVVDYEGRLVDGTVFDSSYARKQSFTFQVGAGNVIPGWDEALLDMKAGEKRTLVLPPNLAYGAAGAGGVIPPNAWLVFDVETKQLK